MCQQVRAIWCAEIGCPTVAPDLGAERWLALMQVDKKTEGGEIRFVLMPRAGGALSRAAPEARADRAGTNHAMNKDGTVVLMNGWLLMHPTRQKRAGAGAGEPPPENRTEFQRDRDHIIHSNAFRRLEYRPRSSSTTKATCSAPP